MGSTASETVSEAGRGWVSVTRAVTASKTEVLSNSGSGLLCTAELGRKAGRVCRSEEGCRFGPVSMCVLVCKTEAVRRIVSELVRRDWLLQSSVCSGTAVSVRRTEVLAWTRAEWAEAAAGSSRFRRPRRHSQRFQFRSASSSALPGGLAPAPAGSPAAGPSPERRASTTTCYRQKTQETRG